MRALAVLLGSWFAAIAVPLALAVAAGIVAANCAAFGRVVP